MTRYQMYVGGDWVCASSRPSFLVNVLRRRTA
jgi:hypothetical protein